MSLRHISILAVLLLCSCTVTIRPRVNVNVIDVTDSLEKQILGDFKIIEGHYLYIDIPSPKEAGNLTKEDMEFYEAMKNRIYFDDIITDYKKKGLLGESESGYLEIVPGKKDMLENMNFEEVQAVIKTENASRDIIIAYIAKKNNESDNIPFYRNTFYKIQVKRSPVGTFIEEKGVWKEKK